LSYDPTIKHQSC